jgi:type I restriction enzyme M protein
MMPLNRSIRAAKWSGALENLHRKYAVTAKVIEARRDAAARLKGFLVELGYE